MHTPAAAAALSYASEHLDDSVALLGQFLAIPAISCDPAHAQDLVALAEQIAAHLRTLGPSQCDLLTMPGAHPCVSASWMQAGPNAPTILVYGHYDLQPVKGEAWNTPPHQATIVGERLYARGSADDMGGWVSHLAAVQAWLATQGQLPCNLRLIIEGEEEFGSGHLEPFMDAHPEAFSADAMILTDCENPAVDVPGLTVSLRGVCEMVLRVRALEADGHSGLWGNAVPDVSTALMRIVAALVDEQGRPKFGLVDWPAEQRQAAVAAPVPDAVVRSGAHLLPGVDPLPDGDRSRGEWLWLQPAITVVATTLPTQDRKKNALRAEATATLSVRTAPNQKAADLYQVLAKAVAQVHPGGVLADLTLLPGAGEGWLYHPQGPAFEAVDRAYEATWGKPMVQVGIGGSIPFVALFGRRFAKLPLILNGVMDPQTTAHGPNESMHLGLFQRAIAANTLLYEELSKPGVLEIHGLSPNQSGASR